MVVGHPRDGILGYFDQFGFVPYGGSPGREGQQGTTVIERPLLANANPLLETGNFTWQFDALEMSMEGLEVSWVSAPLRTR